MINRKASGFRLRFWGVRGSYPTPGPQTLRYGGNTACVEIQAGTQTIIFDAGSGIIHLGQRLLQQASEKSELHLALFFTHAHSDHLLGFPFFAPLFDARTHLTLFGPQMAGQTLEEFLTPLMSPPYFPVDIHQLPSRRTFYTLTDQASICWPVSASIATTSSQPFIVSSATKTGDDLYQLTNNADTVCVHTLFTYCHPQNGALVYRIEYAGHSIVYATDVEWRNGCEDDFLRFIAGADILIHDAQYTSADYQQVKQGYGHSTVEMATQAARTAAVGQLILFHHEPTYNDDQLDTMEAEARAHFSATRSAYEGLEIDLLA